MRGCLALLIPVCLAMAAPPPPPYPGAQDNAAWREAARQRIDRIRKADVEIQVVDSKGRPVKYANVHLKLNRHAFRWGTAVAAKPLLDPTPDGDRYRDFIPRNFNAAVLENEMKWPQWNADRQRALDMLTWLEKNGISFIRGHNLVWPAWKWLPPELKNLMQDPAGLKEQVYRHIDDESRTVGERVSEWDVVNEPVHLRDLQQIWGDSCVFDVFARARSAAPKARLFLNEYDILAKGGTDSATQDAYFRMIEELQAKKAPIGGIGIQGHFSQPTPPEKMLAILNRFARLKLPIAITEFDFDTADEKLQAQFFRDMMIVAFSHPAVEEFFVWGFWEHKHWRPQAAMISGGWIPKPAYFAWRQMVYNEWWTDETNLTDDTGTLKVRSFLGDYDVDASFSVPKSDAKSTARERFTLTSKGAKIRLRLQP